MFLQLGRSDDSDRLALLPVLGFGSLHFVDWSVAVHGDGQVVLLQLLVARLLRGSLVSAQVATSASGVNELEAVVGVVFVAAGKDYALATLCSTSGDASNGGPVN